MTDDHTKYAQLLEQHDADAQMRRYNAKRCLELLHQHLPFRSVIDFGCGLGFWLLEAKQLGADFVFGVEREWARDRHHLELGEIMLGDLSQARFNFDDDFDLAICIEVAEHLPATASQDLITSLTRAADVVLFSAAYPGQGGTGHINEQMPKYWVDRFWQRGFVPLEMIRPWIADDPDIYFWLARNLMVFVAYDRFIQEPELMQFAEPRSHFDRPYRKPVETP
ncbi:MAG: class I SAM-dependent methyltransferase [Pseudomonadota bacterium]